MNNYVIEFEYLNHLIENQNMKLLNKILAFKLLDRATISENQRQMCLTLAHDLTFSSMKTARKRIFSDKTNISKDVTNQFENLNIKQEESVFVVDQSTKLRRKINPKYKKGKITRCVICDSKMHWAKTCPHKSKYSVVNVAESLSEIKDETVCDEEVNIILMTNEYEIMISELEANAIIDTVCMKTVSGEKWFLNFMICLDDTALNKVNSFLVEKYLNLVMVEKFIQNIKQLFQLR